MGEPAAKNRVLKVKKSVFDLFFEVEEFDLASHGSGATKPTVRCIVCRSSHPEGEPCQECAARPFRCIWCYAEREVPIKGACPSCKKFGVTKMLEKEKSCIYVEDC